MILLMGCSTIPLAPACFSLGTIARCITWQRRVRILTMRWLTLSEIKKHEPKMIRLGVSTVARSHRGFLTAYKQAGGNPSKMSNDWQRKRRGFIVRHMAQYQVKPTYRRWLALVAWAYKPDSGRQFSK